MTEQVKPSLPRDETPSSASNAHNPTPGALRGEVRLTVQSRYAQRLIVGRAWTPEKPAIIGLVGFADRLRVIWHAASADDPYADWWLIKIDAALQRASNRIMAEQTALDQCIAQQVALQIEILCTDKPYRARLQFATPYAYRGAHLITQFDTVARTILTALRVGLLCSSDAEKSLQLCAHGIRGLFALPQSYQMLHLDRDTVKADGAAAKIAAETLGELPVVVLLGELLPALSPRKTPSPKPSTTPALGGHVVEPS